MKITLHSTPSIATFVFVAFLSTALLFSTEAAWPADPPPSTVHMKQQKAGASLVPESRKSSEKHKSFLRGTITAVTAHSITIVNKRTNVSHTFKLTPETPVIRGCNCPGTHRDLEIGKRVKVKLDPTDEKKALSVHLKKPRGSRKSPCTCSPSEHQGKPK